MYSIELSGTTGRAVTAPEEKPRLRPATAKLPHRHLPTIVSTLKAESKRWTMPSVSFIAVESGDPFRILISTLLSLRTKDATTIEAAKRLFALADRPQTMKVLTLRQIEKAIYPVGFYHTKARRIIEISRTLLRDYGGSVPDSMEELLKLKGVGRKTANLVLTLGYGKHGICVDTHVHRISNRLGIVKTKTPHQTEFALMKALPKKYWIGYNDLLVAFGQNVCAPVSPRCSSCAISNLCPKLGVSTRR
jgi:endonuclease-3